MMESIRLETGAPSVYYAQHRLLPSGMAMMAGMFPPFRVATYSLDKTTGSLYFVLDPRKQEGKVARSIETEATVIADISEDGAVSSVEVLLTDKEIINRIPSTEETSL